MGRDKKTGKIDNSFEGNACFYEKRGQKPQKYGCQTYSFQIQDY
jgi:hypothetical protein